MSILRWRFAAVLLLVALAVTACAAPVVPQAPAEAGEPQEAEAGKVVLH